MTLYLAFHLRENGKPRTDFLGRFFPRLPLVLFGSLRVPLDSTMRWLPTSDRLPLVLFGSLRVPLDSIMRWPPMSFPLRADFLGRFFPRFPAIEVSANVVPNNAATANPYTPIFVVRFIILFLWHWGNVQNAAFPGCFD